MRKRQRAAGMTEIVLVLPKICVDEIDAQKSHQGLRSRSQVVEKILTKGRGADQTP
jgi:metal-responsive CopG/Arc/MetJ family transcriptional regulator